MISKKIILLLFYFSIFTLSSFAEVHTEIWGTKLTVEGVDENSQLKVVKKLAEQWTTSLDPDCIYLKKCKKNKLRNKPEALAKQLNKETKGYFDFYNENKKRDFGGLSQGFLLDEYRSLKSGSKKLIINFGSDVLILPGAKKSFFLSDPFFQKLPFAQIDIHSGWIFQSSSRVSGAKIRNPKIQKKWQEDFDAILLLGDLSMSGARLDAWSTALIPGGKELLNHLISLKDYAGKWNYAYIDHQTQKLECSQGLNCIKADNSAKALYKISLK